MGPKSAAMVVRFGTHSYYGHSGSCSPLEVEFHRGKREALDMHRRRAGSGSVFWPACVLGTGANRLGIR